MIRLFFTALFVVFLGLYASRSYAYAVPITPGAGVAVGAGGFTTSSSFVGSFQSASFNSTFTTQVAGKAVTMPATMRLAANAPRFATMAVRLNPAGLLIGVVGSWLLGKGLQYISDQWMMNSPSSGPIAGKLWSTSQMGPFSSWDSATSAFASGINAKYGAGAFRWDSAAPKLYTSDSSGRYTYIYNYWIGASGVFQAWFYSTTGTVSPELLPATDAAFDAVSDLPDAVASQLAKSVPLPLEAPKLAPVEVPLSDPYVDPVTQKRIQEKARVSPSADGKTAEVTPYKQELNADNTPATNPDATPKTPEAQNDFCKLNPTALACAEFGEPEDLDLQKKDLPVSITPEGGFGADNASCPSDKVMNLREGGRVVTMSWQPVCQFASGIRPIVIGLAWLAAVLIFVGVSRRNQ